MSRHIAVLNNNNQYKLDPSKNFDTLYHTWAIDDYCKNLEEHGVIVSPVFNLKFDHSTFGCQIKIAEFNNVHLFLGLISPDWNPSTYTFTMTGTLMNNHKREIDLKSYEPLMSSLKNGKSNFCITNKNVINLAIGLINLNEVPEEFFSNNTTIRLKLAIEVFVNGYLLNNELMLRPKISKDFENLFTNGQFSDVKLIVEEKELAAHKAILSCRSSVFAAMFDNAMEESLGNVIRIDDISYDVVKELLRYFYTGTVENIDAIAADLLYAADKYDAEDLKRLCEKSLCQSLEVDNAVDTLVVAERYNTDLLKNEAMKFVVENYKYLVKTDEFKLIPQLLLVEICEKLVPLLI